MRRTVVALSLVAASLFSGVALATLPPGTINLTVNNTLADSNPAYKVTLESVEFFNVGKTTPCYTLTNIAPGQSQVLHLYKTFPCTDVDRVTIIPSMINVGLNKIQPYAALANAKIPYGPFSVKNNDTAMTIDVIQDTAPSGTPPTFTMGAMKLMGMVALD